MSNRRTAVYYFLWALFGLAIILLDLFLSIIEPGAGVLIELIFALIVYWFSFRKKSLGWLIVIISSLIELIAYNIYCSRWSAVICERNLLIISAGPIYMFGVIWSAYWIGTLITKINPKKKF